MAESGEFLASAARRRTDAQILEVILYLVDGDEDEAERVWRAPTNLELIDVFVALTDRGLDPEGLAWQPLGLLWSRAIQEML